MEFARTEFLSNLANTAYSWEPNVRVYSQSKLILRKLIVNYYSLQSNSSVLFEDVSRDRSDPEHASRHFMSLRRQGRKDRFQRMKAHCLATIPEPSLLPQVNRTNST